LTFSLPSNDSVRPGVCEISSTTSHPNRQDSTLYLLNFWDDRRTEDPISDPMAAVLDRQCLAVSEEPGTDPCANPSTEFNGLAPLETWLHERLDRDLWNRSAEALQRQRGQSTPNQVQEALETAIRAAAAITGAIEGLYPITTGQTIMVAERAPNWQTALAGVGETAPALFQAQLAAYHLAISLDASDTGITAAGVRQLHVEICRPQAERHPSLRLGEYKKVDNSTRKEKNGAGPTPAPPNRFGCRLTENGGSSSLDQLEVRQRQVLDCCG
jgi:hypothetical protein